MGLSLTLSKNNNNFYHDFIDAYWSLKDINYNTTDCTFELLVYPSREAKLNTGKEIQSIGVGNAYFGTNVYPYLYQWTGFAKLTDLFPEGIPVDPNEQKKIIYNYIKQYTGLPFQDVFEPNQQ